MQRDRLSANLAKEIDSSQVLTGRAAAHMTTLGRQLRALRIERGLSQAQVAGNLTRAAVSAVELGHIWPSVDTLDTMTRGLGLPDGYLYELYLSETYGEAHLIAFGQRCFERGMGDLARRAMAKLVAIARSKGRNRVVTEVLWRLGLWALAEGRIETATATFHACLDRAMGERDWERVVRLHLRLAELERAQGSREAALERLMTAHHLLAWVGERAPDLRILVNHRLGDLCLELELFTLAREYYQAAWQELTRPKPAPEEAAPGAAGAEPVPGDLLATLALALATVSRRLGDAEEAAEWSRRADRAFAELGEEARRAQAHGAYGMALADLGRLEEARAALLQALEGAGGEERVRLLVELAAVEQGLGQTAALQERAAEALELAGDDPRLRGAALRVSAMAAREAGSLADAFESFLESASLLAGAGERSELQLTLSEIGRTLAQTTELRESGMDRYVLQMSRYLGLEAERRTA
ncbi:MAG: helix-turn-helix transcriptional regulator [Bacillota bacterium]|nr:helix-turn-helix transcriptional regulator [Bacillota bacterium]